jgi:hypothetical protein
VIYNKTDCPKAQQCSFEFPQTIKDAAYYRMEATDSAGKSLWSNPIWSVVESARVAVCANDCASGTKQCSGNGVQTCGNYDTDSCLEWSLPTPCSSGQICSSGSCSAASCTGECSESGANSSDYDIDSADQVCPNGVCSNLDYIQSQINVIQKAISRLFDLLAALREGR